MINVDKILSTLNMFEKEKLDCRTIKMCIRDRCRITSGEGDFKESATENYRR